MIKLMHGDNKEILKQLDSNSIDLTVTSPPYDNLRTYNGQKPFTFDDFKIVASELFRVTKKGGVAVWVVGDATINGSETGTSFRQALHFKEIGFNLHDTMIYLKNQLAFPDSVRYFSGFEYMFVLSKGNPSTFNPIKDRVNKSVGRNVHGNERLKDGSTRQNRACAGNIIKKYGIRWNYWLVYNQKRGFETKHPAIFPEQLANDHIISWSNPGDLIFDPFMGSGTTGKMALLAGRNFMGIELDIEYFKIAKKRIEAIENQFSF